jgi:hypothetical protein
VLRPDDEKLNLPHGSGPRHKRRFQDHLRKSTPKCLHNIHFARNVLAKGSADMVAAAARYVVMQPDPAELSAAWDGAVDAFRIPVPESSTGRESCPPTRRGKLIERSNAEPTSSASSLASSTPCREHRGSRVEAQHSVGRHRSCRGTGGPVNRGARRGGLRAPSADSVGGLCVCPRCINWGGTMPIVLLHERYPPHTSRRGFRS